SIGQEIYRNSARSAATETRWDLTQPIPLISKKRIPLKLAIHQHIAGIKQVPETKVATWNPGEHFVPQALLQVQRALLDGYTAEVVCDPWAGVGSVISVIQDATQAKRALALTRNETEAAFGRALVKHAEWQVGDPLQMLSRIPAEIDVAA